jgi:serine/threonine-protein kinase
MVFEHLGEKDQVKLLDFGIAKLVTESQPGMQADLTSDGTLIGTPRYMAPEQIQGTDIGPPADIYALGLVAYELLTGQRAIKGDSSIQIIGKQLAPQSFQLPDDCDVPPMLRDVVNKMMAKAVSERYQSCDEVVEALKDDGLLAVELRDIEIEEVDDLQLDRSVETVEDLPTFDDEPLKTSDLGDDDTGGFEEAEALDRRPPMGLVLVAIVALVAGFGGVILFSSDSGEQPDPKEIAVKPDTGTSESEDPEPAFEPEAATVRISARLDGKEVEGATVLVNGVEKGVTPLTLEAPEVENSQIVAR